MNQLNKYRRVKQNELSGMSKHALMLRMYKEVFKLLDKCEYVMKNKQMYRMSEFFEIKAKCLSKVLSITHYLNETTDMKADEEIGTLFKKMYNYIYQNASEANIKIEVEPVTRAKNMASKLIEVWNTIPEKSRY